MMEAEAPCKNSIPDKTMEPDEEPQRKNCVLALLQTFPAETPLVTRYTIYTLILSYALSFFWDTTKALSSLPIMMMKHQLYRLVSSPLVCTSGWTLIFSISSMSYYGKKLEYSVGSTTFATLILIFGGLTNLIHGHICFILYVLTSDNSWMINQSHGFWMVLLGLISLEASMAPSGSRRRIFSLELPTIHYPLFMLVLFALFWGGDGLPMSYFISTAMGYALGLGHLEQLKLSAERRSRWEASFFLRNLTSRQGWVSGPSGKEWYVTKDEDERNHYSTDPVSNLLRQLFGAASKRVHNQFDKSIKKGDEASANSSPKLGAEAVDMNINSALAVNCTAKRRKNASLDNLEGGIAVCEEDVSIDSVSKSCSLETKDTA